MVEPVRLKRKARMVEPLAESSRTRNPPGRPQTDAKRLQDFQGYVVAAVNRQSGLPSFVDTVHILLRDQNSAPRRASSPQEQPGRERQIQVEPELEKEFGKRAARIIKASRQSPKNADKQTQYD